MCTERVVRLAALVLVGVVGLAPARLHAALGVDGRWSLAGSLAAWDVFRLDPNTPSERPSSTLDLRFEGLPSERLRMFGAMRVGFDGKIGDPRYGNPVLDLDEIYQSKNVFVAFDEAWTEVYLGDVEIRVGKQKVSWGQLDEIQPTDHVNPEDLTEFYFRPELERKIGVPAVRATGYRGPWTLDVVWAPWWTAYRFPARHDRWFPPLLEVASRVETPLGAVPVQTRYPDVAAPPRTLASSDVALRLQRFYEGAEASFVVFHGWDKTPTFGVRGSANVVPTGDPAAPAAPSLDLAIFPTLHRITVVGADLAVPVWMLALRAEAAWIHGRAFPLLIRDQLANDPALVETVAAAVARVGESGVAETVPLPIGAAELERDAIQWGIGFDYFVTERVSRSLTGTDALASAFVLLQLVQTIIPNHDAPFLAQQVENLLGFTFRHSVRDERIGFEVKVAYNPNHGDFYVWPQMSYRFAPGLYGLLEARVIGGTRTQPIGEYRDYDGIRVGARWTF